MEFELTILRKEQYGRVVYHPVCEKSKLFSAIAGTKTLTTDALRRIKELGYKLNIQHEEELV
jgi:hypothetical protein